ncbi:putative Amino acid transporter [Quillaja saponaria]|uniref:Amino acid transporter n=1 Tax=Quillaja saponaria TaxID=32244 RepID=A0AAD7LZH9_QUISA|nr:putative Amino acid transporter [Quillaja saponaria]
MGFDRGSSSRGLRPPPPREDTPLIGEPQPLSSQGKTFANVFIAVVGAGVLGLPYAFKRTGWITSLLMLFAVAALTHYCMMLLVYTRRKLESVNGFTKIASFGDLGFVVCGSLGRLAVDTLVTLSQAGFCVGYLIFIGNTMADLKIWGWAAPKSFYIWSCFPFQLGLNSIATLTHLAPLSIFADVVDLGAMGVVLAKDVSIFLKQRPPVEAFGGLPVFFYGLGVAVYSFEGIGMVLPLESETKEKEKFGSVLALTMIFIALLYGGFGTLGYLAFGSETKDVITERRFWGGRYCLWMRWALVLVVSLVALFVPNFADFLSLVGSGVCCALGFVLPALFHVLVFKEEMGWKAWYLDMGIAVIGIVLGVSGTWVILEWFCWITTS